MSLFQRAHDIVAAKTNKALDAAEKPETVAWIDPIHKH